MKNSHDKEIGRIIARAMSHEVSLYECASQVQVKLDAIRLDAYRAGMLRAAQLVGEYHHAITTSSTRSLISKTILLAANNLKPEDLK